MKFDTPGEYWIDLKVTDDDDASGSLDEKLQLVVTPLPNTPPVAIATSNKDDVTVEEAVDFNGSFSYDPDGTVVKWEWDFDDDGDYGDSYDSGTDEMPVISFHSAGEHMVDLRVTDDGGATDTLDEKLTITVHDPENLAPVAVASVDKDIADIGELLKFDGSESYDTDGTIASWEWDFNNDGVFGDAYESGIDQMPEISFADPGVHFVNLRVTDDDGAIDSLDEKLVITINEPENQPPVAVADVEPDEAMAGETLYFDGSESYDTDGTIASWEWDFNNDGVYGDSYEGGTAEMPQYSYDEPGEHCIGLKVTDDDGATGTLAEPICVLIHEIPNEPPVAIADVHPSEVYVGETIYFDGSDSYDPDGVIVSWEWDFNEDGIYGDCYDGGTDEMPEYSYDEPGEYCVDLRVTDDDGSTATLVEPVCVLVDKIPNQPPVAKASVIGDSFFDNVPLEFSGEASFDPDGIIVQWLWDFDNDGVFGDAYDSGTMSHPFKLFSEGDHVVNLKVVDDDGLEDTLDVPLAFYVHTGVSITLPEDHSFKKGCHADWDYVALNTLSPSELPIDPEDSDGPWDFTTGGYPDEPDTFDVLSPWDPQVWWYTLTYFPHSTEYVIKRGIVGSEYFGSMYFPEEPRWLQNQLMIYGFFGKNLESGKMDIYPFNDATGGAIALQFPLDITMSEDWTHNSPAYRTLSRSLTIRKWPQDRASTSFLIPAA
jgi:PKD repeat protein